MRVITLASGSRGNSIFVGTDNTKILIDAGIVSSELERRLRDIGEEPKNIDAIIVTHEHSDHIKGIDVFAKKYSTKVFVHKEVIPKLEAYCKSMRKGLIYQFEDNDFFVGDFTISPFEVSHDASHTNGFSIYYGGRKLSVATDIGYFSTKILEAMSGSDLAILESNHDEDMLMTGPYTATLKRRVRSKVGHLSNEDAAKAIVELVRRGTKNFVLAHISQKNNTEDVAKLTIFDELNKNNLIENVHISIAYQDRIGTNYILQTKGE